MVYSVSVRSAIWLTIVAFVALCLAQNSTDSSIYDICSAPTIGTLSPNAPVNSTGMRSFQWTNFKQDWYFTSIFNDTRNAVNTSQRHDFQGYISAPMNTNARACVSMFDGMNATAKRDGGCEGLLSQRCIEYLTGSVSVLPGPSKWEDGATRCDNFPIKDQWYNYACGNELNGGVGNCKFTFPTTRRTCERR